MFFVTSSDSGSLVMAMIASGGDIEPKNWLRSSSPGLGPARGRAPAHGGLNALKTAAITTALPFSIVLLLTCWSTVIAFTRERRAYDRAERAVLLERVGEYYGLEVETPSERGVPTGFARPWRVIRQRLRPSRGVGRPEVASEPDPPVRTASVLADPARDQRLDVAVAPSEESTADR